MLKVKLTRIGKKGQPQYRVVVLEARSKRDGAYMAELGYYNPGFDPAQFRLDEKAYAEWLAKGAQPTQTIRHLVQKLSKSK
jgi:small subunit ribosomal protein S16